jgi:hypothetical protein
LERNLETEIKKRNSAEAETIIVTGNIFATSDQLDTIRSTMNGIIKDKSPLEISQIVLPHGIQDGKLVIWIPMDFKQRQPSHPKYIFNWLTFWVEASQYPDIAIPKFVTKGLAAGSSVDAMFAKLIGEDCAGQRQIE